MQSLKISFLVRRDIKQGTYHRYHNLGVGLTQRGHDVTIYSQSLKERLKITEEVRNGVKYILFPSIPGERWVDYGMHPGNILVRLFQNYGNADVYHLFQSFPNAALPWLLRQKNKQAIFAYDWDDLWMNDNLKLLSSRSMKERWTEMWLRWMETNLPSNCHILTSVSHYLTELGADRGAPNCQVIHNGFWPYETINKQLARKELNLKADAIYAGFMGWSAGEIHWCFEALQKVASTFPNLRLAFCGFNPEAKLKQFPDLAERVDYVGVLPSHEACRVFDAALDLALIPLEENNFNQSRLPLKFHDHLAGGTPILCSNLGEMGRLAANIPGVTSCEPNIEAWISTFHTTIDQLIQYPDLFKIPKQEIEQLFSWSKQAERLEHSYKKLLI